MKKEFDYKNLYLKVYKNIPNIYFVATLIAFCLAAAGSFIWFTIEEELGIAAVCFIGGIVAGFILAYVNRFVAALLLSQKVVVADALLAMSEGASAPVVEDELPEL